VVEGVEEGVVEERGPFLLAGLMKTERSATPHVHLGGARRRGHTLTHTHARTHAHTHTHTHKWL
jgi:hypothetical protein